MKQKIFLDNNGTTALDPLVIEAMLAELKEGPSNPSSFHSYGMAARLRLAKAREGIAEYLGVSPDELIFTSSGTEALNLAILGMPHSGPIITTRIEHAAVYETIQALPAPVTYLPVGPSGHISTTDLEAAITVDTSLIVLSAANSETGVRNPIDEIAAIAERHQIPLIVDGVALLGKANFTIPAGVSAMAFSAHKIHGPKGIGLLYLKKGVKLKPLLFGGSQERMRRAGTENLPGIVGFAKAVELLTTASMEHMKEMRDLLETSLPAVVNGTGPRVCNLTSLNFLGVDGEALLIHLDQMGIAASMGSACSSGSLEPSRVLLEMGLSKEEALSTLRFSVSRFTTRGEIEKVVETLSLQKFR